MITAKTALRRAQRVGILDADVDRHEPDYWTVQLVRLGGYWTTDVSLEDITTAYGPPPPYATPEWYRERAIVVAIYREMGRDLLLPEWAAKLAPALGYTLGVLALLCVLVAWPLSPLLMVWRRTDEPARALLVYGVGLVVWCNVVTCAVTVLSWVG